MSNQPNIALTISPELVTPILQAKVNEAVIAAMGGSERLVSAAIAQALSLKVDADGKHQDSDYYNKYSWLDIVVGKMIREVTKQSLQKMVEEIRPQIEAELKRQLTTKKGVAQLVSSMIGNVEKAAGKEWAIKVNVENYKEF